MLFCPFPGCSRAGRGFARKDNYDDHVRRHEVTDQGRQRSESLTFIPERPAAGDSPPKSPGDYSRYSRSQLVAMLRESDGRRIMEEERRQIIENELVKLRERNERLEEMCLKLLGKNC